METRNYNANLTARNSKAPKRKCAFRAAIGILLWTSSTRPDLAFDLSKLSEKMAEPDENDTKALNNLIERAKDTKHLGIAIRQIDDLQL